MNVFDLPPVNATLNGLSTWIWLYVSITGVIVYFMLYQWFPLTHFDELKKRYKLRAGST